MSETARAHLLARATTQSETQITRAILQYLGARGIAAWRVNSRVIDLPGKGGRQRPVRFGGMKGMSDIVGIVPSEGPTVWRQIHAKATTIWQQTQTVGRFLAIEVKSAKGQPTPYQLAFLDLVRRHGGLAFVARSVDDVKARGL